MQNILDRLDAFNCYCEDSDAKKLRRDAAEEIRRYRDVIDMVCYGYELPPQVQKILESALMWDKQ